MRNIFTGVFLIFTSLLFSQEYKETNGLDVNFFRGNILAHSPEMYHLITDHPTGVMLSFYKKTHGDEEWQSLYNFPDYGGYFLYQDFKNEILGENFAVGAFYNFYFLKRNLTFKIAQGIGMTTNPYDSEANYKNNAFGSKYMANTIFALNYSKKNIIDKFGIQTGFIFSHFSSGRLKSPNSGLNTIGFNLGVNYNFEDAPNKIDTTTVKVKFTEPIRYNFVMRTGFNESHVIGSGQYPFFHLSFYADKRINRKSAFELGTELFLTLSNKEYIRYRSIAYPEDNTDYDTDYKRVGIFIGYEQFINRISIELQLGVYVYQPYDLGYSYYDRVGLKYYITKKFFTGISVKTHGFEAEALEFVLGCRI